MIDNAIESAFCAALQGDDQLDTVNFFTALEDESHKLPAITIISKSESLVGSAVVFRSEVEIRVENHATNTTPAEHARIVGRIRTLLAAKQEMLAALNSGDAVQIIGYAVTGSGQDTNDEKFVTTINIKAGSRSLAN